MSGTLPAWIERLLGIDAQAGEGTFWHLEHAWSWAPWVTLLFAAFAVALVVAIYLREGHQVGTRYKMLLAAIRLAAMGILLVMIAQLSLSLQRTGLPYVAVLVDDSLSMSIVDRYEDKLRAEMKPRLQRAGFDELSRWNLARTLLTERDGALLAGIADRYKSRVYFLTGVRPSQSAGVGELLQEIRSLQPTGPTTRLGTAVGTVLDDLRGSTPAAIVLLSDGINTDGPPLAEAAAEARRKGVPLFTVGLGDDKPVRDLRLSDLLVDQSVFVNDILCFQFNLTGIGLRGCKVAVVLRQQGKPDVLSRIEAVVAPDGQALQLRLPYRPTEVGRFRYVIEATPLEGEVQIENNRQQREVEVRKDKIRVLLVQAYPSFEFRYLRNMLARDDTIELHTVLQDADLDHAEQDHAALRVFPVRRDELFSYDVVILGDANPELLSNSILQNLVDFVCQQGKGGALLLIAGPKYMPLAYRNTPLAALVPIDLATARYPEPDQAATEGFAVQPTELGLASPAMQLGDTPAETQNIWKNLPTLYWMLEAPTPRPAARVLAENPLRLDHDGRPVPVICMQYVGAGRVLLHATDETWRWRWRTGDVYFARYWIQTIRYLARSKLAGNQTSAELSTDRREYRFGQSVRLQVRFADERMAPAEDDGVTVVLEHQGHKTQRLKLQRASASRGIFEGIVTGSPLGTYHAWVAIPAMEGLAPAADFTVAAPPGEFEQTRTDTAELRRAAERTKGRFYTFATADRLLDDLPEGRQIPIESLPPMTLWDKWPMLLLLLVLLTAEWILRKRGGMV